MPALFSRGAIAAIATEEARALLPLAHRVLIDGLKLRMAEMTIAGRHVCPPKRGEDTSDEEPEALIGRAEMGGRSSAPPHGPCPWSDMSTRGSGHRGGHRGHGAPSTTSWLVMVPSDGVETVAVKRMGSAVHSPAMRTM